MLNDFKDVVNSYKLLTEDRPERNLLRWWVREYWAGRLYVLGAAADLELQPWIELVWAADMTEEDPAIHVTDPEALIAWFAKVGLIPEGVTPEQFVLAKDVILLMEQAED